MFNPSPLASFAKPAFLQLMPTRNVNLTPELDKFILDAVATGRYENASEVVRTALRIMEREEQEYQAKLSALRSMLQAGLDSGVAKGDIFDAVLEEFDLAGSHL